MPRPAQADLFGTPRLPEGFRYAPDMVPAAESAALVTAFADLPFKPFEFHGYLGNRRVVSFGWRYDYGGRRLEKAEPMPAFLMPLRARAAAFADVAEGTIAHALVTEYAPGAGIGWHRDKPEFDDVVAFSFCAPCTLRFRRKADDGWERISQIAAPRSAYLLRGPARQLWEHSIPPVAALRYSVTFRTMVAAN